MITKEQEQYIIDNYKYMTYQEIGNNIGKSPNTVAYYIKKNNLDSKRDLDLSDEDKQYIINNYKNKTYSDIGDVVGLSSKQIEGWLRNHLPDKTSKKRIFNDRYFETIDSKDKAYWLGFIYADGWISISKRNSNPKYNRYEFGMELQERDGYMLERLNNILGGKHIVRKHHNEYVIHSNKNVTISDSYLLKIYSKNFVLDLFNNGIDIHKSNSKVFPLVDDSLFPDFLRGYIDGDGCLYKTKNGHLVVHITGANIEILKYIQEKLRLKYNIQTKIYSEKIDGCLDKHRLFCYQKESVKRLLDLIYYNSDSIKLNRKYQIYKDFYGLVA